MALPPHCSILLAAKRRSGLSFADLGQRLGQDEVWTASLLYGQATASAEQATALLEALEQWIALSPVRQGPWGVEALHRALLGPLLQAPLARWPLGTPVLNRQNRPEQGDRKSTRLNSSHSSVSRMPSSA